MAKKENTIPTIIDTPEALTAKIAAGSGEFIKYKGRSYCWVEISQEGQILLTKKMMDF